MTDEDFARAARTYGDTVYRVAYHALNSTHDAEDVMQTVLLKLYESKDVADVEVTTGMYVTTTDDCEETK